MKGIFNPHSNGATKDIILVFMRIVIGLLLITHGYPKLVKLLSGEPVQFASIFGMSEQLSMTMAMFAEFICAILVMFGFATRLASIPIILTMLVIVFHVHADDPVAKKELPMLYLVSYIYILFMGAGKYSIDYLLHKRLKPAGRRSFR